MSLDKLAYSLDSLVEAVDLSKSTIREAIKNGDLVPSYVNSKPIITREEAERWLRSLPSEKRAS